MGPDPAGQCTGREANVVVSIICTKMPMATRRDLIDPANPADPVHPRLPGHQAKYSRGS